MSNAYVRCPDCDGSGGSETCTLCGEVVDNCTCDGDEIPEIRVVECEKCAGSGEVEREDVDENGAEEDE